MKLIPLVLLQKLAANLPARNIKHEGRPYLRRYYLGTAFGIRFYIHHFVDSDPDGLHNHPWLHGGSILLNEWYWEERRWCMAHNARKIRFFNLVGGDDLHRVVVPEHLRAVENFVDLDCGGWHNHQWIVTKPWLGVWTLFWHSKKVMPWATIKNKGSFKQYYEEDPQHSMTNGHSDWWKTAPLGKEVFPATTSGVY